jgi:DNA repair photolyase
VTAGPFAWTRRRLTLGGVRAEYREEPCKTALNRVKGMPFEWTLNPYMGCVHRCTFCYVRAYERRADRPWDERYGASIRVKTNVVEVLRRELSRQGCRAKTVAIGGATDPYQPAEGRYRLARGCVEVLGRARNPFGIVTRGPLIVRDVDVLREAASRAKVTVSVSVPTLDDAVWRTTEPGTAPPRQRLRAVRALSDAGIDVSVGVAPVIPGLSDGPASLAEVITAARDAGASGVWCNVLHLRPGTREHFLENLAKDWPALLRRYEEGYRGAYLPREESDAIARLVKELGGRIDVGSRAGERIVPARREEQLVLL